MDYGELHFKITEILEERGISKNRICGDLKIPRAIFNRYCRDDFRRIDVLLVRKLCAYLHVAVSDLIEYIPPEGEKR